MSSCRAYFFDPVNETVHPSPLPVIQDQSVRDIAKSRFWGGVEISTVFLNTDHNFTDTGPPLLFETMIFGDTVFGDSWCIRTSTCEQAKAKHAEITAAIRFLYW